MKKNFLIFIMLIYLLSLSFTPAFAATKKIALFGLSLNSKLYVNVEKPFIQRMSEGKNKINYRYVDVKSPLTAIKETNIPNPDIRIDIYSPDGDKTASETMVKKIKTGNYDIILVFGTPGSIAIKNAGIDKTPVVFGAVIDPKAAGIVKDVVSTGTNFTGVSTFISMKMEFATIKDLVPNAKKIGMIQSSGEQQLELLVNEGKQIKGQFGIDDFIVVPVNVLSLKPEDAVQELSKATQSLVGKVDAIYIPGGAITGSQASKGIIDVANANKIPTIAFSEPAIENGATAGVVANLKEAGTKTADILNEVIKGIPPTEIPVSVQNIPDIIVNLGAAKKAGIEVPSSVLDKATKVIDAEF